MNYTSQFFAAVICSAMLIGIIFHDMHLDRAASMAIGTPLAAATGIVAAEAALKKAHPHVHVDHVEAPRRHTVRTTPNGQPARDELREYTSKSNKKVILHFGADNGVIWPSV